MTRGCDIVEEDQAEEDQAEEDQAEEDQAEEDQAEEDQAEEDSIEDAEAKRRKVMFATFQKWHHDFDIELKTVTWMSCETETSAGKVYVKRLKCSTCTRYKSRIIGSSQNLILRQNHLNCLGNGTVFLDVSVRMSRSQML